MREQQKIAFGKDRAEKQAKLDAEREEREYKEAIAKARKERVLW